jgi:F-type H+-transporting ATPase subunit gamma
MAGLKQIKSQIRSYEKTQTVTKAMEAVSAAKMRKAQVQALSGRPYASAALSILERVSGSMAVKNSAYIKGNGAEKTLYIVITSDKGLAGSLNSGVLKKVYADMQSGAEVIAVGKKANDFFTTRGVSVQAFHANNDQISTETIDEIVREAVWRYAEGHIGTVKIAYQNFISTLEQKPILHTVLPLTQEELHTVVDGIAPVRGAFSETAHTRGPNSYTTELSGDVDVLSAIMPKLVSIFVYHALLESQASEHSARMVSMKSASDKAGEKEEELTLQFNKARQAAITREVSEIIGGMEAMAS